MLTCSPHLSSSGGLPGCLVELEESAAITMSVALQESSSAKALVSAQHPHMVQMVNEAFTSMLGLTEAQVIGRSLQATHGPCTDAAVYRSMMQTASIG